MKNFDASVKRLTNLVIVAMLCLCPVIFAADPTPPVTSDVVASPVVPIYNDSQTWRTVLTALATEDVSDINQTEYFLDIPTDGENAQDYLDECLNNATRGLPLNASDGAYDNLTEWVNTTLEFDQEDDAEWMVCVRAQNNESTWGACDCITMTVDTKVPSYPKNGSVEPEICNQNRTIWATVCDDETPIVEGRFCIEDGECYPMEVVDNSTEDLCENLTGFLDVTEEEIDDGCHKVFVQGRDKAGNWGKTEYADRYGFILDTTSPKTNKTIIGQTVECNNSTDGDGNTLDAGCFYVNQSAKINLTAADNMGVSNESCRAESFYTEYQMRWRYNWTTDWTEWSEPVNYTEPIAFENDSIHEIRYRSVDSCGNAEVWHYEIDIVDTVAPVGTKIVDTPRTTWDGENAIYYNISELCWNNQSNSIDCWKVTLNTSISMSCVDPDPHPVGNATVCFNLGWDGDDVTEAYCSEYGGDYNTYGDGFCCVSDGEIEEFYFLEKCEHNLQYYCIDALGNKGETDDEKFKVDGYVFNITLNKKWNLISTPLNLLDSSIEAVFSDIANETISVWTYDGETGNWSIYSPGEGPDTLTSMNLGWGYWVLMNKSATLEIGGTDPCVAGGFCASRQLAAGWNLIGYYGNENLSSYNGPFHAGKSAASALANSPAGSSGWTSLKGYWSNSFMDYAQSDKLDPGAGYILYLNEAGPYTPTTIV